jgi:hypothetical protein
MLWELSKDNLKKDAFSGKKIFEKMTPLITEVFAKEKYLKEGYLEEKNMGHMA